MKKLHILFTGVGRRVELVQSFRQAALMLPVDLKIFGADMSETAPALAFCDACRKVCAMQDQQYIPQLLEICGRDAIDLLIPTIDTDLLLLAKHREQFASIGTTVLISRPEKIALCRDKSLTESFFRSCGLYAPPAATNYREYNGSFPCFIKPKDGSSSINAFKIANADELAICAEKIGDYVVQPFIDGTEYTVDILCDFDGNPITVTPRIRLAVRSGEVLKTQIALDRRIIGECSRIVEKFQPCGPITVQLIREKATGADWYIEINPRFGGGAPLSMKAGADSAEAVLRLALGPALENREQSIEDGAIYSRFDQSVCIAHGRRAENLRGVIFDLDDTLYSEKEYVKSGYRAVAQHLGDIRLADRMWQFFEEGKPAISALLSEVSGDEAECLAIYRSHTPNIHLYDGAKKLLEDLRQQGIRTGIITDGRPEGQRNKIKVLGLEDLVDDIIVTDELGGEMFRKPCDIAFRILQRKWRLPFGAMAYIGDNPAKDFHAPIQLGMLPIWVKNEDGLYRKNGITFLPAITNIYKVHDFELLFKQCLS